jgi:excisionase family DNA binding protein
MATLRRFFTTKQIADMCGVHITTAIRWIDAGELRAYRTPGGRRRVAADELQGFLDKHKIPVALRGRPQVLVVDDDEVVLRAMARQLNAKGRYEVTTASSAYDALITIGQKTPDLVVLDLLMPRVDGYEACRAIKSSPHGSKIKVVCVTGRYSSDALRKVKELGALGCYSKEQAAHGLLEIVESALA